MLRNREVAIAGALFLVLSMLMSACEVSCGLSIDSKPNKSDKQPTVGTVKL